jgi:soluble lytic murein transglycosylase
MNRFFIHYLSAAITLCIITIGCSAQRPDPLAALREMTRDGKLPAESVVADIERRSSGTQTASLAKLLRGRIKFENKDFAGAAALLNSDEFEKKTSLGDYALWLRGRALQEAGDHAGAMAVFERIAHGYAGSLRAEDAHIRWAESAIASGRAAEVPQYLQELVDKNSPVALLAVARAFETAGRQAEAIAYYRKAYAYGPSSTAGTDAEAKLKMLGQDVQPANAEEMKARADRLLAGGNGPASYDAYTLLIERFPTAASVEVHQKRLSAAAKMGDALKAQSAFAALPSSAGDREQAYRDLINAFADAKQWTMARAKAEEMRRLFPNHPLTAKTWVEAGYAARDARNKGEENFFLQTALAAWPNAVDVAGAQFELAWMQHESRNFARSSTMLTEHLARYADKDTTNRGKAGYWAARDSEQAGKIAEACTLYEATAYRYGANWYGYLANDRLGSLKQRGQCKSSAAFPAGSDVARAAANLKTVTVAPETSGPAELDRAEKSEQLSTIGLFDWAIEELQEAKRTADNSPKINLALAKHYRLKGDNVNALLALAKSYPDYAQMFPEEMGREEWEIFYPHVAWDQIVKWAKARDLDLYKVAGLIRQESVFNPRAASSAKAYGLMQLLLPTARMTARKFGSNAPLASATELFQPALNIELGTAYMREQLDKYGRIEYMAVAYNAGPGRVVTWRRTLPVEMDEFVEAIPFRETKGYVQGVIRNTAQYRRLYDENGNFRPNVGTNPVRTAIDSLPGEQLTAEFPEVVVERSTE